MADKPGDAGKAIEAQPVATSTVEHSGIHHELAAQLAQAAKDVATRMDTRGHAAAGTREALHEVGIDIPRSNSADIRDIPKTKEMGSGSALKPGDIVITGVKPGVPYGNSFIVTPDMKAASDRIAPIPDLKALPNVHIYRPQDS